MDGTLDGLALLIPAASFVLIFRARLPIHLLVPAGALAGMVAKLLWGS